MRLPLHDGATPDVIGIFADEGSALLGVKHWIDEHGYKAQDGVISSTRPTTVRAKYYNYNKRHVNGGEEWLAIAQLTVISHKVGTFLSEGHGL